MIIYLDKKLCKSMNERCAFLRERERKRKKKRDEKEEGEESKEDGMKRRYESIHTQGGR